MLGSAVYSVWILQVLLKTVTASLPEGFLCRVGPGNYSLSGQCGSYVECRLLQGVSEGGAEEGVTITTLAPVIRSCGGRKAFSLILRRCVDHTLVTGCNRTMKQYDLSETYDPSLDYVCSDEPDQYVCVNCKTLVNCVNGRAFPRLCDSGDYCFSSHEAFGGDVCYPGRPNACVCKETNVLYRDVYDAEAFFRCDESRETAMHYCAQGHWFDATKFECRSSKGLPSCKTPGTYAVHSDCRRYYACILTTDGFLQHEFRCPDHNGLTFYDERTGKCKDPCGFTTPLFACTAEGRFADPTDCRRFHVCTWDATTHTFRQVLRQCPEGSEWEQVLRSGAGHCTTSGTVQCTPVTATRCTLPPGLCT